jgi:hypothetical protein
LTVADPSTLGAAAGAGSLALQVGGLTLAFAALPRALPLMTAWLLAAPGLLGIVADDAAGTGLGSGIALYPDPDGGLGVGGRATVRFDDAAPVRDGTEVGRIQPVATLGGEGEVEGADRTGTDILFLESSTHAPRPAPSHARRPSPTRCARRT